MTEMGRQAALDVEPPRATAPPLVVVDVWRGSPLPGLAEQFEAAQELTPRVAALSEHWRVASPVS